MTKALNSFWYEFTDNITRLETYLLVLRKVFPSQRLFNPLCGRVLDDKVMIKIIESF